MRGGGGYSYGIRNNAGGYATGYYESSAQGTYVLHSAVSNYDAKLGGYYSDYTGVQAYNQANFFQNWVANSPFDELTKGSSQVTSSSATNAAQLQKKLNYIFGKATGDKHNIDRSKGLLEQLNSIGIYDTPKGRQYIYSQLMHISNKVGGSTTTYSSLLWGIGGTRMMVTVWKEGVLATIFIKGG